MNKTYALSSTVSKNKSEKSHIKQKKNSKSAKK